MTSFLHHHRHPNPAGQTGALPPLPRKPLPVEAPDPPPLRHSILYGCFSCPWCYLASQRSDRLAQIAAGGAGTVTWRMIEPEPHLPVTGHRLDSAGRRRLEAELAEIRPILLPGEQLPCRVPGLVPNTGPAVAGFAEACGAGVADPVRRVLFDAYWQHGADIGNPEVLRRLLSGPIRAGHSTCWPLRDFGYAVSLAGGPVTTDADNRTRDWCDSWAQHAGTTLPVMIDEGGRAISGRDVLTALRGAVLNCRR